MAKGKRKGRRTPRKGDGEEEAEFDEHMSTTSYETADTYGSALDFGMQDGGGGGGGGGSESSDENVADGRKYDAAADAFKDGVEMLTEKRGSTREAGLRAVMKFMLHSMDLEPVLAMQETTLSALIGVLRKRGSETEGVHALRALSVLCVCIGPDEDEVFHVLRRPLRALITRSRYPGVRVAAVRTLALSCFVCSNDSGVTSETIDLLAEVFAGSSDGLPVPDELCAAALSGWGLLVTTVTRSWVATRMTRQYLRAFSDLLGSGSMEVRVEAGENIALLHESRLILGLTGGQAKEEARDGGGGEGEGGGGQEEGEGGGEEDAAEAEEEVEVEDLTELWDDIVGTMKGLIAESSKKMSKETRKKQRQTFREFFATVAEDVPPEEFVSLQNGSLKVADWAHIKQLNALRSCLQSGFQTQMQSNDLLREILGVSKWGGTAGEKEYYSKNSDRRKQLTTDRIRLRQSKHSGKHRFLDSELA